MITEAVVRKLLATVDAGLIVGMGSPVPGQMCVEAAVCYALGLPHGDNPDCVAPAVRALKIRLNDSCWSSDSARAKGMRRLAVIQLGTTDNIDEQEFAKRTAVAAIRICVPFALRAAAKCAKGEHVAALLDAALLCQNAPTYDSAIGAKKAASAYANAYAYAAYAAAAYAYANAAYAAYAAYAAAAAANAAYAADDMLSQFAEAVVQILVDLKAPGAVWLPLTEEIAK